MNSVMEIGEKDNIPLKMAKGKVGKASNKEIFKKPITKP